MSIARMVLHFDYEEYLKKLNPVLVELANGNPTKLRDLAREIDTSSLKAKVWHILSFYYVFPHNDDFDEKEDEATNKRVALWLMLTMSEFCSTIDDPLDFKTVSETLRNANIDEKSISLLAMGKSFESLYSLLDQNLFSSIPKDSIDELNNCPAGWLSADEIESLKFKILTSKEKIPQNIYEKLLNMLSAPNISRQGLILGISF